MKSLHGIPICVMFGLILGLIGVPPITSSLSSSKTSNFYQPIYAQPAASSQGQPRPNILLIMGDDFGFSDLGAFGSEISTPNQGRQDPN